MGDIHGWLLSDGCIYLAAVRLIRAACAAVFIWRRLIVEYVKKPIYLSSLPIFLFLRGMAFGVIRA